MPPTTSAYLAKSISANKRSNHPGHLGGRHLELRSILAWIPSRQRFLTIGRLCAFKPDGGGCATVKSHGEERTILPYGYVDQQ